MTRDKKTGHFVGETHDHQGHYQSNVTPITPGTQPTTPEDDAVAKLKDLTREAIAVRSAMDFCVKYISVERLIAENMPLEATIAYAARHQCTMMDAREYVSRVLAERQTNGVCLTPDKGVNHE